MHKVIFVLKVLIGVLFLGLANIHPSYALNAEEQLQDPVLESRARALSAEMRCLVCQNQSIDDSDAPLAKDLRTEVRELLQQGKSDQQILDSIQQKYGDYVLLNPPLKQATLLLWWSPLLIVLIGGFFLWRQLSHHSLYWATDSTTQVATVINSQKNGEKILNNQQAYKNINRPLNKYLIIFSILGLITLSGGLYYSLGRPDLPSQPYAARQTQIAAFKRTAHAQQESQQARLIQAQEQAIAHPEQLMVWLDLMEAAIVTGDSDQEIHAITQARRLEPNNIILWAAHAEALSRAADGQMTLPARELIAEVLRKDPSVPQARYLSGLAHYQDEKYALAVSVWKDLLNDSPTNAPWFNIVVEAIARAAEKGNLRLPNMVSNIGNDKKRSDASDMSNITNLPLEDQQQMIHQMVQGLAERLQEDPDNLVGWQRLAQSYKVLDKPELMINALLNIARLKPQDWQAQLTPLENMLALGKAKNYIPKANILLERLRRINPNHLQYLFFAGHYAKIQGKIDNAIAYWQQLQQQLPPDSPTSVQLKQQIDLLKP